MCQRQKGCKSVSKLPSEFPPQGTLFNFYSFDSAGYRREDESQSSIDGLPSRGAQSHVSWEDYSVLTQDDCPHGNAKELEEKGPLASSQ